MDKITLLGEGKVTRGIEIEETVEERIVEDKAINVNNNMDGCESEDTGFESVGKPIYETEVIVETTEELPTSEIEQPEEDDFVKSFNI